MSVKQMALVWEHEFPPNEQLVMLAMADHANDEGGSIFPSLERIAWKTGYSRRSVQRIVSELRTKKILKVVKASKINRPNEYRIQWKYAEKKPPYVVTGQDVTPISKERVDTPVQSDWTPMSSKPSVNHQYLATLEEVFNSASNIPLPEDWGLRQKRWRTPLKRMYGMAGDDAEKYIRSAVTQMRKDKLTISASASIENVFTDLYAQSKTQKKELEYVN